MLIRGILFKCIKKTNCNIQYFKNSVNSLINVFLNLNKEFEALCTIKKFKYYVLFIFENNT